jgi:hypothetical protein
MAQDKDKPRKNSEDLVDWFTVSYRSIYIGVFLLLALASAFGYWYLRKEAPPSAATGPETTPTPAVSTASIVFTEGSVQVKKAGRLEWLAAARDMILHEGDLVRTGGGSGAEIHFTSGTIFHMRADSLITIEKAGEDPDSKRANVTAALESGVVNFSAGGAATTIQTRVSTLQAGRNAQGDVSVNQSGEATTKIFEAGEGAAVETRDGKRVTLGSNQGVMVDAAGKAGETMNLPAEPQLVAPPLDTEISYPNPSAGTTLLSWKAAANAASYHVLVDFTPGFTRPLVDQKGWKPTSMELRGFDPGKYFWKVAAVDASGVEGGFSDVSRFSVTRSGPGVPSDVGPPLAVEKLDPSGNVLHVKGKTAPGASLTVNGQRVDVQTDGTFNEFITLERSGRQTVVIRATSIGGGVTKLERSVAVTD